MSVWVYIFPLLSLLILYHDRKLIFVMGLIALVVNLVVIMTSIIGGEITLENSRDAEIMIALIVLVFTFSYSASELYEEISNANDAFNEELEKKTSQLSDMTMQTITTIANTIDAKDGYTEGHSARVAQYSRLLAKKLGKSDEEADEIYNIALLHDIGKIGVPDSILNKPGKLTEEEFNMIKQHPMIGAKILNDVKSYPSLQTGAKYHHERYDGRGYPEGLSGTEIPEIARIICVADSFDAMHSNRVYRRHFTKEYIRSELEHCQGTQFDPEIAKAMLELIDEGALEGIDTRREENFESPDGGRGMAQFSGIDRRSHETPEIQKELEAVSNHIRDYLVQTDEKDLLDTLAEENRIQDFEMKAGELLQEDDGCLILLDIDQFSNLNHKYGFLCGDVCLRMIAETLLGCENMLVCRYEGDSFHVLLEPNFGLSIYDSSVKLNTDKYSRKVEVLYSTENGVHFDGDSIDSRELIPGYKDDGENHMYAFLPLHEADAAYGYIVFRDCAIFKMEGRKIRIIIISYDVKMHSF